MNRFNYSLDLDNTFRTDDESFMNCLPLSLRRQSGIFFTAYARNGLYASLKSIQIQTNKREVLVPAYSCGDEIQTIIEAGFNVSTFNIDPVSLDVDLIDLKEKIGVNTIAILVTHYFGFPQKEITTIKEVCKTKNIFLIEDCAHAINTKWGDHYLGSFGDVSIFSLRKFYPIPHGGVLIVNNTNLKISGFENMSTEATIFDTSVFFSYRSGSKLPGTNPINTKPFGPRLEKFGGYNLLMSHFSKYILMQNSTLIERNKIYNKYYEYFNNKKNEFIYPLFTEKASNDITPLFFPIVVKDSEKVCRILQDNDIIIAQPFWSHFHPIVEWKKYPDLVKLKQNTLVLPVYHELSTQELSSLYIYATQ